MNQLLGVIPAALVLLVPHTAVAQGPIEVLKTTLAAVSGGPDAGRHTSDVQYRKAQATKVVEQADAVIGSWELNLAKSTFTTTPPRSSTRAYEAVPNGLRFVGREVDAAGEIVLGQWTAFYDGQDYPTTGSPHSDTISIKRIDSFTGESIQKKAGKVVTRNRRVISSNGKVMTLIAAGTDAQGQPFTNVLVFDRR